MGREFESRPPHPIYLRKLQNPHGETLALTHNLTHYGVMATVYIETDERYPDYLIVENGDAEHAVDVDAVTLARWQEAEGAYNLAQSEMAEALRAARNSR